jgi:hypothetical protein
LPTIRNIIYPRNNVWCMDTKLSIQVVLGSFRSTGINILAAVRSMSAPVLFKVPTNNSPDSYI